MPRDKCQTCVRCLNDAAVAGIDFDPEGICSYCREYERWKGRLTDWGGLRKLWLDRVERHRGKGADYDALVGLSGGKDSSYVLLQLQRVHGLRVLAVTFDNGFLTEDARHRADRFVAELGVDHRYVELSHDVLEPLYRMSVVATGAPCTACSLAIYAATIEGAAARGIPMAVHGRSRPQMFRTLDFDGEDPFTPFVRAALEPVEAVDLDATYGQVLDRIRRAMPTELVEALLQRVIPSLVSPLSCEEVEVVRPEFLPYFVYHPYDERAMVATLERETSWRRPEGYDVLMHFDCEAHDAATYLYERVEGRPHILPELSAMVREGGLSRAEGRRRLAAERMNERPDASLGALATFLGMGSPEPLLAIVNDLASRRRPVRRRD